MQYDLANAVSTPISEENQKHFAFIRQGEE